MANVTYAVVRVYNREPNHREVLQYGISLEDAQDQARQLNANESPAVCDSHYVVVPDSEAINTPSPPLVQWQPMQHLPFLVLMFYADSVYRVAATMTVNMARLIAEGLDDYSNQRLNYDWSGCYGVLDVGNKLLATFLTEDAAVAQWSSWEQVSDGAIANYSKALWYDPKPGAEVANADTD